MFKRSFYILFFVFFLHFFCSSVFGFETISFQAQAIEVNNLNSPILQIGTAPDTILSSETQASSLLFPLTDETSSLALNTETLKNTEQIIIDTRTSISTDTSTVQAHDTVKIEKPASEIKLSSVKPGLSLMSTAYARVSQKHPSETGLNADFLFNFYIGEIYERMKTSKDYNVFFVPYRIYMFGFDLKYGFNLGQLLDAIGIVYREDYAANRIGQFLNVVDPGFKEKEQKYFPTVAVGMRGWIFSSMGSSFDLTEAFEGAEWIQDYYFVVSKKIGDWGIHVGYVYGSFFNSFFEEIKSANVLNQGKMGAWNVDSDCNSNTFYVGVDVNVPWGNKKFSLEAIFPSADTYLINTATGLWGFDLAFLKIPPGFSVIGYWSFRSNMFTIF